MLHFVQRESCVICGGRTMTPILTTPPHPIFQGCVSFAPEADECAPMAWSECTTCGSAQIVSLPPLERIYQAGHATGLGAAWARHHAAFVEFLKTEAGGAVVDVGGGSGTLAAAYRAAGGCADWTILEPNALRAPQLPADVAVIDGFLDSAALARIKADSVVMCHVLEHVTDIGQTLRTLSQAPDCAHVLLAWPELEAWTQKGLAGALNFEHGIYLTLPRLTAAFAAAGWRLKAARRWDENDTWFLSFVRGAAADERPAHGAAGATINAYYARFRQDAEMLARALDRHDGDAFLMPASIYAQALLAHGLPQGRFKSLLDNAPVKQGRRLYGTNLWVESPAKALPGAKQPLVILNGGAHETEIAASLLALRPDIRILAGDGRRIAGLEGAI